MSGSCDDRGVGKCRASGAEISLRAMSDISAMCGHTASTILRPHQGNEVHRPIVGDGGGYRVENRVFALSLGLAVGGGLCRRRRRSASSPVLLAFEASYARTAMVDDVQRAGGTIDEAVLAAKPAVTTAEGGAAIPSRVRTGLVHRCAPVPSGDAARAALTIPFVAGPSARVPIGDTQAVLREPLMLIAEQLALLGHDRCGKSYA